MDPDCSLMVSKLIDPIDKKNTPGQESGYMELILENSNFRRLWFGQIVSLLGDWFNLIASASLLSQLTHSGFAIGGLFAIRMLSPFLISPLAGAVADRNNRKNILILSDLFRAFTVSGFLLVREPQDVWLLYALTSIQLALGGFFFPARNAILPDIVSSRELGVANAISAATWSVMLAFGAGLGGIVSGTWGIYPAFLIDALTFLISSFFILGIRYQNPSSPNSDSLLKSFIKQYFESLNYLRNNFKIFTFALQKGITALVFSSGFQVIKVVIGRTIFPLGKGGGISLGLIFSVAGLGTGIGPIIARYFAKSQFQNLRYAIVIGYLLSALGLAITIPLLNIETVLLGNFVAGMGGGIIWVFSSHLLLQMVPGTVRGRVFATEFAIFTLLSTVGVSGTGLALDSQLSIARTLSYMCVLTLLPAVLWLLSLRTNK